MNKFDMINSKIVDLEQLEKLVYMWRFKGFDIVFTNGCFDLLHRGHIHLLANAADVNEKLIVGLNSDASVTRLKGANRPILDEESRKLLLASMALVDAVIIFEEDTPAKVIETIKPDVIVKGSDYKEFEIVGADVVSQNNGKVRIVNLLDGYGTTKIEEKILKNKS